MYKHALENYKCPICLAIKGIENEDTLLKQADLIYKDETVSVYINSFWVDTARGHVIVVPNDHIENIYEMSEKVGCIIFAIVRMLSLAMKKAYKCDGITTRQNNEPAGDQHAFHYHHHIFPRYDGDSYNLNMAKEKVLSDPRERKKYANKLRKAVKNLQL